MKLMTFQEGQIIFNEGDQGDYFYIILQGEVEILRAQKHKIVLPKPNLEEQKLQQFNKDERLRNAYAAAIADNFDQIFWPRMGITHEDMNKMLSITLGPVRRQYESRISKFTITNPEHFNDFI